ncbi:MAG: hypothetical protein M3Q48_01235 [Actinomycetota bacterium]|nr:hypothetical protein [Actinomycetota bacterium]
MHVLSLLLDVRPSASAGNLSLTEFRKRTTRNTPANPAAMVVPVLDCYLMRIAETAALWENEPVRTRHSNTIRTSRWAAHPTAANGYAADDERFVRSDWLLAPLLHEHRADPLQVFG